MHMLEEHLSALIGIPTLTHTEVLTHTRHRLPLHFAPVMHRLVYEGAHYLRVCHADTRYLDRVTICPPQDTVVIVAHPSLCNALQGTGIVKSNLRGFAPVLARCMVVKDALRRRPPFTEQVFRLRSVRLNARRNRQMNCNLKWGMQ